ncbi:hypothetical protein JTE90_018446 [Oedothorax gibbosus]|uniref:Uncharacterized protein n=1 Tax=Oedothorax gibbosus TaxID=931172 RepID=A0AAV6UY91_9ARAC|nr:hypothetical protein JTE90_018446 [Oedothorax gibbosus]
MKETRSLFGNGKIEVEIRDRGKLRPPSLRSNSHTSRIGQEKPSPSTGCYGRKIVRTSEEKCSIGTKEEDLKMTPQQKR